MLKWRHDGINEISLGQVLGFSGGYEHLHGVLYNPLGSVDADRQWVAVSCMDTVALKNPLYADPYVYCLNDRCIRTSIGASRAFTPCIRGIYSCMFPRNGMPAFARSIFSYADPRTAIKDYMGHLWIGNLVVSCPAQVNVGRRVR